MKQKEYRHDAKLLFHTLFGKRSPVGTLGKTRKTHTTIKIYWGDSYDRQKQELLNLLFKSGDCVIKVHDSDNTTVLVDNTKLKLLAGYYKILEHSK